ncbi:MAG: cytochrome c [Saprospiraceae bacterium]|nr:cytochrome c [Saprospiraceae bacterium]
MIRHYYILFLCSLFATPVFALQDSTSASAADQAQKIAEGEKLFTMYCKACHQLKSRLVGPPLQDVSKRRDEDWIIPFVKSSSTMIQSGDSVAIALFEEYNRVLMPDLPLEENQIRSVLAYVDDASSTTVSQPISRPVDPLKVGPDPFRFDDFGFWMTYTVCVVLLIVTLYLLVENFSISHPDQLE